MQHQRAIRHILKDKKVQEEIFVAFRLFRQSRPATAEDQAAFQWHSPSHRCTEACRQFFHGNVCVCELFGNWHYCTQETCNEMIRTREHMVCPLSGNTYDLAFEMEEGFGIYATDDMEDDQPVACEDDYGAEDTKEGIQPATKKKKKKKQEVDVPIASELLDMSLSEHRLQDAEQQHEKAIEESKKRQEEEANRAEEEKEVTTEEEKPQEELPNDEEPSSSNNNDKLDDVNNRHSTFHLMLTTLFKPHETRSALFSTIMANAERLWILVHSSGEIKKKQFRYQPSYHILAILSCMCTGYTCSNKVIVPLDAWIKTRLPLTRDIHKLPGIRPPIKVPPFTSTKKMFQRCIADIALHSKHQSIQWIA